MYTNLDSMIIWTLYEELKKKEERKKEKKGQERESAQNPTCVSKWKTKPALLGECIVRTQSC